VIPSSLLLDLGGPPAELLSTARALGDPNRILILYALSRYRLNASQLSAFLGISPSNLSQHISVLRDAGLVSSRRRQRWVYYERSSGKAPRMAAEAWNWFDAMAGEKEFRRHDPLLDQIAGIPETEWTCGENTVGGP